jgi:hypothetical protein
MTTNPVIDQVTQNTIQSAARSDQMFGGSSNLFLVMAHGGSIVSPWWSPTRDHQLRAFWKKSDHLAGAVYTMTSKMTAIPNKIVARDTSIRAHVEQADYLTDVLQSASGIGGEGWIRTYGKFVEDLVTVDNGAFMEIIGLGDPLGPILGQAISVAHLDSTRCTRTGNAIYPVVYQDIDGKIYRLHRSRVMYAAQQPSPIAEMYGVGVSSVSRCINVSQTLIDILMYKQEKLGSRPQRQLIITQGGLDPVDIQNAFFVAESEMDNIGLRRYSKMVIGGSSSMPEGDLKVIDLSSMPDGFDEETSITLGIATIALAFGIDARELFPSLSSGSTKADALLQHLKQRGKGPGQILQDTEQLFNYKFLPAHLRFVFDFQDDAQDRQIAEIREIRANRRVQDLTTNALTKRALREQMYEDGDISNQQFERLELDDGRMPDGIPVTSLFYKKDGEFSRYLDLGVADPLNVQKNDPEKMIKKIAERRFEAMTDIANATTLATKNQMSRVLSALDQAEMRYRNPEIFAKWDETPELPEPLPGATSSDPRIRTANPLAVSSRKTATNPTNPSNDDE